MNILVTGGAGFIGSHLCEALIKEGHYVICVDNFNDYYPPEYKRQNISSLLNKKNFILIERDINDKGIKEVFSHFKLDKVVHLAARAGVRPSVEFPELYEETNVKGTLNMLELAKAFSVKQFIFGSSSSVYGENKIPFSENDCSEKPLSPYAATKKAGELLCYTYSRLYKIKITCLRFFTVYGPRGRPDMAPYIFTKLIHEGKPITVYGEGTSRDYTYVADIVDGIIKSIQKEYDYEIFNLGNSDAVSINEFISIIEQELGKKAIVIKKELQKGDVPSTFADISKAKKMLSYNPKTKIREGMHLFIKWYLSERA